MGIFRYKLVLALIIGTGIVAVYKSVIPIPNFDFLTNAVNNGFSAVQKFVAGESINETTVYSSRDNNGAVKFSDQKPDDNHNTKTLTINPNANLIPAVSANKNNDKKLDSETEKPALDPISSPANIGQLIDDTKNIENILNTRKSELDNQLDNM